MWFPDVGIPVHAQAGRSGGYATASDRPRPFDRIVVGSTRARLAQYGSSWLVELPVKLNAMSDIFISYAKTAHALALRFFWKLRGGPFGETKVLALPTSIEMRS